MMVYPKDRSAILMTSTNHLLHQQILEDPIRRKKKVDTVV